MTVRGPASRPCGSCPYRRDVPSGIWVGEEYERLPRYDAPTGEQPPGVFLCHQQDGRLCAGWVGCHDMDESLALRIAALDGTLDAATLDQIRDYATSVPLWESGQAAADHGMRDVTAPAPDACRLIDRLEAKAARRESTTENAGEVSR